MSKINIRESLNRLDIKTDNKYDLRNTYDCSNISDDKKKELAEALNKNASAKEISKLLSEDYDDFDPKYDARYEVDSYYGANYSGLEDNLYTNDFEEVKDWVWEKCQKGLYINVVDRETGNQVNINPENYDWESDDAYRILDDLEEVSPLNEEYEDDVDNSQYLDTNDSYRTEVSSELRSFLRSIEKGKSWDEALVNLGYKCVDPGCIGWSKETEDGEIYVSFENLDDEGTIENSKINFAMFDKNGDVVEEDSFDFRMRESLKEGLDEEQLYKIVCKSGASEWPFESALSYEDAQEIVEYYNGRWIDERGFEWSMEIEEDDESTERAYPFDESLKEGLGEVSGDFAFARKNWDKLGTGVSFDDALEEYNDKYGEEYFYAKPIYVKSAWNKMVSMFTESLKEAVEDEVEFEETDFNDEEVDEGVNFFEGDEEWTWEERVAGPVNIDFDNWSVWKAKKAVDIRDFIIGKNERGGYIIDEEPFYKAHEDSERAYFVVDEDTGFIDWGPVENRVEAQDFLNGKISDWEEETGFRHPMHNDFFDESLKESKDIEDTGYSVVLHYDDIGGGEEYDYEASWDDVVEVLRDVAHSNGDGPEDANEDEYLEWVMDNFDKLTDKYELNVLDYFEDSAREEHSDIYGDEYIKDSETGSWYRR